MTKSSYVLLIGIAIMIVIGAAVWNSTGGSTNSLPTTNSVATPIVTTSTTLAPASSTKSR